MKRLFKLLIGPRARRAAVVVLIAAAVLTMYNVVCGALANRWDARAERDPETKILVGAEELRLGPKDARTAVLLVHGFIGGSNNFAELPQRLASEGYYVDAMRLPGHGTSPHDFAREEPQALLQSVLNEIRALKKSHERVFVVGHSMGGSLTALASSIEGVDGVVLAAPCFGVTHKWYYVLPPEVWARLTGPIVRWYYKGDYFIRVKRREVKDEIFSYRWVHSNCTRTLMTLRERARLPEVLEAIECPALVIQGRGDNAADPAATESAFADIGSADKRFVWLEGSDHHVFWDNDREQVYAEILNFIRGKAVQ